MMFDAMMSMDGLALFSVGFGGLAIIFGLILLIFPSIFSPLFDEYDYIARLVGAIQILGGILIAGSVLFQSILVAYFFLFIGIGSIATIWCIASDFRTPKAKRKSKPKHQKRKFNL